MKRLLVISLMVTTAPLLAQHVEDEQTQDYEERDRLYRQRYLERQKQAEQLQAQSPQELEQAFLDKADRLLKADRNYRAASSELYRVQTDDARVDPDAVAGLLDTFRAYFDGFWGERHELRPYDKLARAFLFYSYHDYNQMIEIDFSRSLNRPKCHYGSQADAITVHTDSDSGSGLADTLVHEAAHQLIDQRLFPPDAEISIWLSEGLATYFGFTYVDRSGAFRAGQVGRKVRSVFRGRAKSDVCGAAARLRPLREAWSKGVERDVLVIEQVLVRGPASFYGAGVLSYPASWMLVHFLLHGDDGAHADAFSRYIELEADGRGRPEALYREIDLGAYELEQRLAQHVKRIKIR